MATGDIAATSQSAIVAWLFLNNPIRASLLMRDHSNKHKCRYVHVLPEVGWSVGAGVMHPLTSGRMAVFAEMEGKASNDEMVCGLAEAQRQSAWLRAG